MLGRYATWRAELNTLASCTWYEAEDLGTELAKILLKGFASKEERMAMLDTLERIKGPAPFSRTMRFLSNETFVCEQVGDWPIRFAHLRQPPINTQEVQAGVASGASGMGSSGMGYSGDELKLMRDVKECENANKDEEGEGQTASDTYENTDWKTPDERQKEEDPYARGSSGPSQYQHQPKTDDSDNEMNEEEIQQRILKRLIKRRSLPEVEDNSEEAQQERLEEEAFFAAARRMYRDLVHQCSTFTREKFEQEYQLTWVQTHWRGKNNLANRLT